MGAGWSNIENGLNNGARVDDDDVVGGIAMGGGRQPIDTVDGGCNSIGDLLRRLPIREWNVKAIPVNRNG